MAEDSNIGWTHHTWNPWQGCHKVSAACAHCYIGPQMRRGGREPFEGPIRSKSTWSQPSRFQRIALETGQRQRVFTCSLSDFFHEGADAWREDAWNIIRACDACDWLILTKRPERIAEHLPPDWGDGWPHVWLGVTVEENRTRHRLDKLLAIPAAVHWVSCEPLLEPLNLQPWIDRLDWIVCGGESGPEVRLSSVAWYRHLYEQARQAGAAFYMKQDTSTRSGQQGQIPDWLWSIKQFPHSAAALPQAV